MKVAVEIFKRMLKKNVEVLKKNMCLLATLALYVWVVCAPVLDIHVGIIYLLMDLFFILRLYFLEFDKYIKDVPESFPVPPKRFVSEGMEGILCVEDTENAIQYLYQVQKFLEEKGYDLQKDVDKEQNI